MLIASASPRSYYCMNISSLAAKGRRHMPETGPAPAHRTYTEQAISIRELAAQAKFTEVRAQLLVVAALYEKLEDLLRDAALHSLITMASTLHGDSNSHYGDPNSLHGDLLIPAAPSLDDSSRVKRR
jgi:hypothetical protein